LTVTAAAPTSLSIAPVGASAMSGVGQAYTATTTDPFGNSVDVTGAATFTIGPDGSCAAAVCTATRAGLHTVTGSLAGLAATAKLTITIAIPAPTGTPTVTPRTAAIPRSSAIPGPAAATTGNPNHLAQTGTSTGQLLIIATVLSVLGGLALWTSVKVKRTQQGN
jgi:hypothetical protein